MFLFKYIRLAPQLVIFSLFASGVNGQEELKLEETQVNAKPEQPEVMTIVSRQLIDLSQTASKERFSPRISEEIRNPVFDQVRPKG